MHNRWLLWGLLIVGGLAAVGIMATRQNDDRHSGPPIPVLPIREWPKARIIAASRYSETLDSLLRTRVPGTVLLPKEPTPIESKTSTPARDIGLVPPQVCGECHAEHASGCQQTAHFRTSSEAARDSIRGQFEPPQNRVKTSHPSAWFELVSKPDGFYQQFFIDYRGERFRHEARFDLVIGSGKLGQSYLFWVKDALHELPVSHFSDGDHWASSPGADYPEGIINFARPIAERCLDCHATWFELIPQTTNRFVRESYVLGVTCSRCHGRGREHVEHHRAHPDASVPHRIVNPANLPRDLANAVCAQCHSGAGELVATGFLYQPGEPLADYLHLPKADIEGASADPHAANQLLRLEQSACFQKSEMSCFACHDPHRNERGRQELFAERCLKCHQQDDCGQCRLTGNAIGRLCIECHMPLTQDMDLQRPGQLTSATANVRDHQIQVWPATTASVLKRLAKSPAEPPLNPSQRRSN